MEPTDGGLPRGPVLKIGAYSRAGTPRERDNFVLVEPGADRRLVLVVDDDQDIRELVVYRLGRSGYDVIAAADGAEAIEVATEKRPALIVLDVMMPKLSGLEVVRRLRQTEETKDVPVILLSASVQDADVAEGFEAGADDYLKKPFSPQELRARVQAILDRR